MEVSRKKTGSRALTHQMSIKAAQSQDKLRKQITKRMSAIVDFMIPNESEVPQSVRDKPKYLFEQMIMNRMRKKEPEQVTDDQAISTHIGTINVVTACTNYTVIDEYSQG